MRRASEHARRTARAMTRIMADRIWCKLCQEINGIKINVVVDHRWFNDRTGRHFTAPACARCLQAGRVTRVTCRTFVRVSPKETA